MSNYHSKNYVKDLYADNVYLDRDNRDVLLSRAAANVAQLASGDGLALDNLYFDQANRDIQVLRDAANILGLASGDAPAYDVLRAQFRRGRLLYIPTNSGWTSSHAGSGAGSEILTRLQMTTGATASSRALYQGTVYALNPANAGEEDIDWDKGLVMAFCYERIGSDSECTGRIQLKTVTSEGQLADKGLGMEAQNLDLYGESYGTGRGTVDLSTAMTSGRFYHIAIVLKSGSSIEWFVNGTSVGSQTTAAKIPSGTSNARLVVSIVNGGTGGVSCWNNVSPLVIWQET